MNPTILRLLLAGGAGGGPTSSDIVNPPGWLAHLKQRAQPMSSGGGGSLMPLGSQQPSPGAVAPVSISSHPVMSQPIAAPGPVNHMADMNPFSLGAGGSLAPPSAPTGMGMQTPWAQMNQGASAPSAGGAGAPGGQFPTPMMQPGGSQGFPGAPQMGGAGGGMPQQGNPMAQQGGGMPQQGNPMAQQGGSPGSPGGYGSFQASPLMGAGNSLMSMLGLGPNAGQPSGMQGGTQGPALIQKFMQMLHGSGSPFGNTAGA